MSTHVQNEIKKRADLVKGKMRKITPETRKSLEDGPSDKKIYPHFRIDLKYMPEAKKGEIGKNFKVTLELTQTGINIDKYDNSASFDIKGIAVLKK